jgi:hypothetical protein
VELRRDGIASSVVAPVLRRRARVHGIVTKQKIEGDEAADGVRQPLSCGTDAAKQPAIGGLISRRLPRGAVTKISMVGETRHSRRYRDAVMDHDTATGCGDQIRQHRRPHVRGQSDDLSGIAAERGNAPTRQL